jgi:cell wall-associated NlpC family hydrolase
MRRVTRTGTILMACLAVGCASRGAVPRPFPGASERPAAVPVTEAIPETTSPAGKAPPDASAASAGSRRAEANLPAVLPAVLATALTLRGTPYKNGGSAPSGFDCSGFVQYVFARHGRTLPREVRDQFRLGTPVDRRNVRPGDLVFFETVSPGASHVGIALGGDEFVHAPSSRGVVRVERYTAEYWAARWVGARRIA